MKEHVQGNGDNTELGLVEKGPGASAEGGAGTAYHGADHGLPIAIRACRVASGVEALAYKVSRQPIVCQGPRKPNVLHLVPIVGTIPLDSEQGHH